MKVKPWREKCKENGKERGDFSEAQLRGSGEPQEGKDAPPRESDCPVALPTVFLEHQKKLHTIFLVNVTGGCSMVRAAASLLV